MPIISRKTKGCRNIWANRCCARAWRSLAGVEARFGWIAETIEQDADGVRVTIAEDGGAGREIFEADYVVGCDGGHSMVRQQIGIERGGADFNELMVLALFRSRELHEKLKRFPPRSTYRVLHPDLQRLLAVLRPRRCRRELVLSFAGAGQYDAGQLRLSRLCCRRPPVFPSPATSIMSASGICASRSPRNTRSGRVFIAGDAAHSHPPYGGYGLNNGLDDVANLGWKLAAKLKGWGGDALLQTYTEERRRSSRRPAEDFIEAGIQRDADISGSLRSRARSRGIRERLEGACRRRGAARADLRAALRGLADRVRAAAAASAARAARTPSRRAPAIICRRSCFRRAATCSRSWVADFTLLAFDGEDQTVAAFEKAARSLGVPLKIVCDSYQDGRTAYEAKLMLVRPDRYIAWTGDSAPADAAGVIAKAVGRA